MAPPIDWAINSRGQRGAGRVCANSASSLASRSKCRGRGRVGHRRGRSEPPCPRQSRHHTDSPRAARSAIVSKYFSMHSEKPLTITHSARGFVAAKWPQRSFAPSGAAKLPQTRPGGSRNRAGSRGRSSASSNCLVLERCGLCEKGSAKFVSGIYHLEYVATSDLHG